MILLIEIIRKKGEKKGVAGMILVDLSKAFDCMRYVLLVAKVKAYGFALQSLRLIVHYLSDKKQSEKVASTHSD